MKGILVRVSAAELLDRLSILYVKAEKILAPEKLQYIRRDIVELESHRSEIERGRASLDALMGIHREMWECNEQRKAKIRNAELDADYLRLTVQESVLNDRRYVLKREIDEQYGSELREQKSYPWA
jgi:hypothetical protein